MQNSNKTPYLASIISNVLSIAQISQDKHDSIMESYGLYLASKLSLSLTDHIDQQDVAQLLKICLDNELSPEDKHKKISASIRPQCDPSDDTAVRIGQLSLAYTFQFVKELTANLPITIRDKISKYCDEIKTTFGLE
ncbi:MAG TPA: hypothetical protein PKL83_06585 [bacterium]|nr:hypothetical protein [bacterium]